MKKKLLISLLIILSLLLVSCERKKTAYEKEKEDEIAHWLDYADDAMKNDNMVGASSYYVTVLNMDSDNKEARYGLVKAFERMIYDNDFTLTKNTYSYVFNLEDNEYMLEQMHIAIEEYDESVLEKYRDSLADAFFSDENQGVKELSGINMELDKFIYSYDSIGFKKVFLESLGEKEYELDNDLIYYADDENLRRNLETYVVIHNYKQGQIYLGLYILDTKEVHSDDPIHISDYNQGLIDTYSTKIEDVQ